MDIKNLKELLQPYLEKKYKLISYTCRSLLPPGENYGSLMIDLNINVENKSKEEEIIQCVAKTVPPSKVVWKVFNTPITFKKEITFYEVIVPIINEFGNENGMDNLMYFFPKCFGARISLDPKSEVVDRDAVFILENLKTQGYITGDRFTGFGIEAARFIIKHMALMHASVIAVKLTNPKKFEAKILPYLNKGMVYVADDKVIDGIINTVSTFASRNSKCVPLLERVEVAIKKMKDIYLYQKIRNPFATILHNDIWTNNMMIKFEDNTPISMTFLDFQVYEYGSPLRDLIFFLYSSVKVEVLEEKIDDLLKLHYDVLIETLLKLKCPISSFSFELFMEEAKEVAFDVEFPHIMFMLTPIFTLKDEAKELAEWTPDQLGASEDVLHENYNKHVQFTILDFAKRQWI